MKALLVFVVVVHWGTYFAIAQNVGIGTPTPMGALHIKSPTIQSQLVLDAAGTQGNFPRIIFRDNLGTEQLHIRTTTQNLFFGLNAGQSNSGFWNTGFGLDALQANQTGSENTAVGVWSMSSNTVGQSNTAVGQYALYSAPGSNYNTAIGNRSLLLNFSGSENTAIGALALHYNYSGNYNTAIGVNASYNNSTGAHYNVALGYNALYNNTVGVRNIAIGAGTGTSGGTFGNTISIGNHNYLNAAYNQAFLGNLNIAWTGGNVTWSTFSDARIKRQITEDVKGLPFIMKLRPVTYFRSTQAALDITGNKDDSLYYEGKNDIENIRFSGFLAQEVEKAAKESGYDFQGVHNPKDSRQLYSLSYETFVVPLVKAVQEQQAQMELLKEENKVLKERLERLEKHLR